MTRRLERLARCVLVLASGCVGQSGNEGNIPGFPDAGGIANPCEGAEAQPMAWDETTALGVSAKEVFEAVGGSCRAPFWWDGHGFEPGAIEPTTGQTEVLVELELDHGSARFFEPPDEGASQACPSTLEIDAHVRIRTDDGRFDDEGDAVVRYRHDVQLLSFARDTEALGGSLSITPAEGESAQLSYTLDGAGESCAGEVSVATAGSSGQGLAHGSVGVFGSWSRSGCRPGERVQDLSERVDGLGTSPRALLEQTLGELTLQGSWDDGTRAALTLSVEIEATEGCADAQGVLAIPLALSYGTSDGAVAMHTAPAAARLSLVSSSRGFSLWLSEQLECDGASDTSLAYTLTACDALQSVELQLGLDHDGAVLRSAEGLNAYEYLRDGSAAGGADRVRVLSLQ
jgi:hypothetical protein